MNFSQASWLPRHKKLDHRSFASHRPRLDPTLTDPLSAVTKKKDPVSFVLGNAGLKDVGGGGPGGSRVGRGVREGRETREAVCKVPQ